MKRGQIWWAELDEPVASEPGYKRPVIIIQADEFTESRIRTIIAVAITSNLRLVDAPGNVLLPSKTGLRRKSVANVSQIITLDKEFLSQKVGQVDRQVMRQIDEGIKLALAL